MKIVKKIIVYLLIAYSALAANSNIDILFVHFVERVSQQNNINIYIDEDIENKTVSLFIPKNISNENLMKLFKNTVSKMNFQLNKIGNNYHLSKKVDNNFLYTLKYNSFADCQSVLDILNVKYKYLKDLNSFLITSNINRYEEIKSFLNQVDLKQKQVILKVMIFEFQDDFNKERGIQFGSVFESIDSTIKTALNTIVYPMSTNSNIISNNSFYGAIRLLNENKKISVKQFPYVLVKNNKPFKFEAVSNIPYLVTSTKTEATNTSEQTNIEYKDVGLKINGISKIYDDYITLDMDLIVEDLIEDSVKDNMPQTYKRRLNSSTNIDFDNVLLLSGIKQTKQQVNNFEVPFISNIPYLGNIFKHKFTSKKDLDITIAIEVISTELGDKTP